MIRGTTPTFTFIADMPFTDYDKIEVTFGQHKKPILTKYKEDCIINDTELAVKLTEAESLLFDCKEPNIQIQIVCAKRDTVVATEIIEADTVKSLLKGACLE